MRRWIRFLRYHCSWLSTATGLVIVYLAIINPLACLIHCARHEAQSHDAAADSLAHYVCLLASDQAAPPAATADHPIPLRPQTLDAADIVPQAVYAGILISSAPAIAQPGRPSAARTMSHAILQRSESPPSPPPEHAES